MISCKRITHYALNGSVIEVFEARHPAKYEDIKEPITAIHWEKTNRDGWIEVQFLQYLPGQRDPSGRRSVWLYGVVVKAEEWYE